ncbi:MAG: hypothetical protein A3D26_02890 [Candidatus Blackburnbacteria bacterium RIFCSPHIGHO2_02_FULL_44_20]|uniref:Penicillin-binding protein 2 n=1 Tax=Candidatus Blackburnbacteria bacterium RIFCSPHIGHO2_02_FULL_44_20 TaxID=1797516 RepID=A0A1G1V686_9BACT|nr:MAG: hypothetical protein A3D26_02890 [Candidatus Blackburnbacteria bacterium RIFCSPHIGHO2_02_FULL_44_20]OGY11883.1 MAG: hypothetical protein A3E16_03780 [Candidatus Blackburnbacteria bacterium RIFCSPHIGHO2_12_FULL_44_25]
MVKKDSFGRNYLKGKNVFGEGITGFSTRSRQIPKVQRPRWLLLLVCLFVFSLFGLARLFDLQIVRGSYFRSLSDGNRVRRIPIRAPRGEILDRNGQALARNVPVYKLAEFSSGGVVTRTEVVSREEAIKIQSSDFVRQSRLIIDIAREYPLNEAAAHLVGYVGEASPEEIASMPNDKCPPLGLGDLVGRGGIEQQYDCLLRGVDGEELVEVDTQGRLIRRLGRREAIPGESLSLYADATLQKVAYDALQDAPNLTKSIGGTNWEGGGVRGAIVAQEVETGGILAFVSYPSFNPSTLGEEYSRLSADKNLPLFNRVIGGAYHPGSTFKVVSTVAGFEDGKIDRLFQYEDTGRVTAGTFSYSNWYFTQYGRTEGVIDVVKAIARSTDTFFYKVGELVGAPRLAYWAEKFGYGRKTGIDLPGEVAGLIPNPEWKLATKGERWFLGNTYHMAIGQGDVAASPLQVNQMTQVVASGGVLCKPRVVKGDKGDCGDLGISKEALEVVQEGMKGACSADGTAFPFFNFEPRVACKTGTAQTVGENTHAWFTVFGPVSSLQGQALQSGKQIVLTVLVEEAGEGSRVAAPVARRVLEEWFKGRK